jgi:flagellar hook-length control protein FliK
VPTDTTDSAPTTATAPANTTATTVPAPTTTPATTVATVDALAQGAAATVQGVRQATAAADDAATTQANATAANTQPTGTTATTAPGTGAGPAPTWADLAANFGAQLVSAARGAATRSTSPTATGSGPAVLTADGQLSPLGSTAQAAGAVGAAPVMLPGQAVTATGAAGAAGQNVSMGSSETADASTVTAAGPQAGPEITPEFNLAALGANNVGQAAAANTVQADAATPPPVANQIADTAATAAKTPGQSVEMILQPEGLGTVTIKVTMERGGMAVHLAVDNQSGRDMVQNSWPQLQHALEQRGLTVQSLQLDLSNSGRGNSGGDQFQAFQQFASQQQGFAGQSGQQAGQGRGSAGSGNRRGLGAVDGIDEPARPQTSVGISTRVDYRI